MTQNQTSIIGILGNNYPVTDANPTERYAINKSYLEAVILNGGIPLPIPCLSDSEQLKVFLDMCDGLLLPGGVDVNPSYYGEEPHQQLGLVQSDMDAIGIKLIRLAAERKMPILGICRGQQMLNVALGGSLYQDIAATYEKPSIQHQQKAESSPAMHKIKVEEGTLLFEMIGSTEVSTNTLHHQAVKALGKDLVVSATALDGIIEAIESKDRTILGLQWHPELMIHTQPEMNKIFAHFIHTMSANYKRFPPFCS